MDATFCITTGPKEQSYTIFPKVVVQWDSSIIYCGFRNAYTVTLSGVTGNTLIKIFCRTNDGELLDECDLQMNSIIYMDKFLIPSNVVAGTNIYIEIHLPEYGVVCKSASKPVHNSIPLKALYVKNNNCGWIKRLSDVYLKLKNCFSD